MKSAPPAAPGHGPSTPAAAPPSIGAPAAVQGFSLGNIKTILGAQLLAAQLLQLRRREAVGLAPHLFPMGRKASDDIW